MHTAWVHRVRQSDLAEGQQASDRQAHGPLHHIVQTRRHPQTRAQALPRRRHWTIHRQGWKCERKHPLHRSVSRPRVWVVYLFLFLGVEQAIGIRWESWTKSLNFKYDHNDHIFQCAFLTINMRCFVELFCQFSYIACSTPITIIISILSDI